jgi:hypothetical protein
MKLRSLLMILTMWSGISAVGVAAEPAPHNPASGICPPGTPPSAWHIDDTDNDEYQGLIPGETTMNLQLRPGSDEWQIEFVGNKPTSPKPPKTDVMHFIKVCWKEKPTKTDPFKSLIEINPYLVKAFQIMEGKDNYFIGTGNLEGEPTMILLKLNAPAKKSGTKMGVTIILVKLDERTAPPAVRQGGVIHGTEN